MHSDFRVVLTAALAISLVIAGGAMAQKRGGVLKISACNPGNLSILEEPESCGQTPMMGVFNNLVLYDQHQKKVSLETVLPELATSWAWNEDGTELTFRLRQGVKWHDGKPFTAADVKCSFE